MEEQKEEARPSASPQPKRGNGAVRFLADILRGVAIGVAFIIPGFSGGSVAAVLGVYERIVGAVADLFKRFGKSLLTLLPFAIGMFLGAAALFFPISLALAHFPIPTVCLFVGLALGGIPTVTERMKGGGKWTHFVALFLALAASVALCFLPQGKAVDLFSLDVWGYILLFLVGAAGACALVVPGISGSLLLLIFGYYNPILELVTEHLVHGDRAGLCIAVLAVLALGILAGFFGISVLMKFFLKTFPRGTHFAIFGFLVGSVPAVFVSTVGRYPELAYLYTNPWYWVAAVLLFLLGIGLSLGLVLYARKRAKNAPRE